MGSLASLLVSFVTGEAGTIAKQVRGAAIAYGLALLGALVGMCFLVLAAYLWAARRFGSIEAALGFGIGIGAASTLAARIEMGSSDELATPNAPEAVTIMSARLETTSHDRLTSQARNVSRDRRHFTQPA